MTTRTTLLRTSFFVVFFAGACGGPIDDEGSDMRAGYVDDTAESVDAITRVCSGGTTLRGIDISYYQGTINWDRVKANGVHYAFIRVSDGLANPDSQFARNWAEAKRVGVRRGVYQYFRPNRDVIAQADLLLSRMGPLEAGDLPPVIDVETNSGLSASVVSQKVEQWIDYVQSATGVAPIIYTGPYFWRDNVGAPAYARNHPLWIAHYTTGCPLTPEPWTRWTFHQFTDSGSVDGISGNVDTNYFNGTAADLAALGFGGSNPDPDPDPNTCEAIGSAGRTMEEDDSCVELGGPAQYLRSESGGSDGSHVWTGVTSSAQPANFARWALEFDQAGLYRVEAHVAGASVNSRQAGYRIKHSGGEEQVFVNQTTSAGFVELGSFNFATSGDFWVRLDDNTGEASSLDRRAIFDAVRLTPISAVTCPQLTLNSGVSGLNVRSRPSTTGAISTVLSAGARVTRLATVSGDLVSGNPDWHRIRSGSTVGYASARYMACLP
jgi:GH25 family lysozyme M1 (1,4-beta-N-acetylmuramidase)